MSILNWGSNEWTCWKVFLTGLGMIDWFYFFHTECGSLSDPVFGEVMVDQTTYGHTATFYCFQGYILSGSAERTCSADGYWTGTQPVCTVTGKLLISYI